MLLGSSGQRSSLSAPLPVEGRFVPGRAMTPFYFRMGVLVLVFLEYLPDGDEGGNGCSGGDGC